MYSVLELDLSNIEDCFHHISKPHKFSKNCPLKVSFWCLEIVKHCPLCYLNVKAIEIHVVKMLSPDFVILGISASQEFTHPYQVTAKPDKIYINSSEVFVVFS